MSAEYTFTKNKLDECFKELGKEYRKRSGKNTEAEIVLIGGASVLINYMFRDMTDDADAVIEASSAMKESINAVGDRLRLPRGWLNTDFKKTGSYSVKLREVSKHYRQYSNVLNIRTVAGEYLVAMKLMSGRVYKYDLSDIVGILFEHERRGEPVSKESVEDAVGFLYGNELPEKSKVFFDNIFNDGDYERLYGALRRSEKDNKELLLEVRDDYPGILDTVGVDDILAQVRKKKKVDGGAPNANRAL